MLKKYKFIRGYYSGKEEIEVEFPDYWKWVKCSPVNCHYKGQIDYMTVVPSDDILGLKSSPYLRKTAIPNYVIICLNSVDENPDMNVCSIEELNASVDWTQTYMAHIDRRINDEETNGHKILSIIHPVALCNTEIIYCDVVHNAMRVTGRPLYDIEIHAVEYLTNICMNRINAEQTLTSTKERFDEMLNRNLSMMNNGK